MRLPRIGDRIELLEDYRFVHKGETGTVVGFDKYSLVMDVRFDGGSNSQADFEYILWVRLEELKGDGIKILPRKRNNILV